MWTHPVFFFSQGRVKPGWVADPLERCCRSEERLSLLPHCPPLQTLQDKHHLRVKSFCFLPQEQLALVASAFISLAAYACGHTAWRPCSSGKELWSVPIWPEPWTPRKRAHSPSSAAASWSAALTGTHLTPAQTRTHRSSGRQRRRWEQDSGAPWPPPVTHPSSLLGQTQLGSEACVRCGERDALKHTLLHLGDHQPHQHAQRWAAHIQAGSVGEIILQVIKRTWTQMNEWRKLNNVEIWLLILKTI